VSTTDERTGVQYPDKIRLAGEPMDEIEAHSVVRAIKFHGVRMCQELVRAHDGQAWLALGHDSWGTFCEQVLAITRQRANQLVKSARNQTGLALMFEVAVESIDLPERWIRGATLEDLRPMVETAVSTLPPDATYDQRVSAIVGAVEQYHREHAQTTKKVTQRRSESTTTETSSDRDPAPGADESGGEAKPDLLAASLPDADVAAPRDEGRRDGADESDEAAPPADESDASDGGAAATAAPVAESPDPDGHAADGSGKGPDASPPVASGPTEADEAATWAAVLKVLSRWEMADLAVLVPSSEWDRRRRWVATVRKHMDTYEAAMAPKPLEAVK
jgi:hypothetical protein